MIAAVDDNPKRHLIQLYAGWLDTLSSLLPSNSKTACELLEGKNITSLSINDLRCTKSNTPLFFNCGRDVRPGGESL